MIILKELLILQLVENCTFVTFWIKWEVLQKTYKSFGYSNGNLKRHLDEVHGINEVEIVDERKKVRIYVISYLIFLIKINSID